MKHISYIKKTKHDYFVVSFGYDKYIVSVIRSIPTSTYNARTKDWLIRVSEETAPRVKDLFEIGFSAEKIVTDKILEYEDQKDSLYQLSDAEYARIKLPDLPHPVYPFQKAGIKYMVESKRCFNGDDMGLGKTLQSIVAAEIVEAYPLIVACPNRVKKKWRREIAKWIPHRSSMILDDNNFYYGHDIMILNYEAVIKYLIIASPLADKFNQYKIRENIKDLGIKGVIVDESHYVKNPKSKRTKAIRKLCENVEYIWMLSGTIVNNRPEELISQLQIMRRFDDFGGYQYFTSRYCDAKKEYSGNIDKRGSSNLIDLNRKLKERCLVRRTKLEVRKELPGKSIHNLPVEIDNREEYELVQNNVLKWIEKNREIAHPDRLGLFNGNPSIEFTQEAIELQILNALRIVTANGKIAGCIEWIKKFLARKKKLVVFANHIPIQKRLIKAFPGCARIIGGMSTIDSDRNEQRFKKDGCDIIICSLKGANTGIDLVSAYNYFCVELDWTPSTHDQAEDRLNRIGQHKKVNCFYPLAVDTIDEDMFDLHQDKRNIMSGIMDGKEYNGDYDIRKELIQILKKKGHVKIPEV